MNKDYEIKPLGETSVIVKFGNAISPAIHNKIQRLADYLEKYPFTGMVEYVMSYTSLVVYYNPFAVKKAAENKDKSALQLVTDYLDGCMEKTQAADEKKANVVEIPVCYGGKYGPDIEFVAEYNHLSVDEVIQIHTAPEYLVYMIGFCPGFPYLGGMDERIATPRRDMPRLEIPARSIGIADKSPDWPPVGHGHREGYQEEYPAHQGRVEKVLPETSESHLRDPDGHDGTYEHHPPRRCRRQIQCKEDTCHRS